MEPAFQAESQFLGGPKGKTCLEIRLRTRPGLVEKREGESSAPTFYYFFPFVSFTAFGVKVFIRK